MRITIIFLALASAFGQTQSGTPKADSGNGLDPRRVGVRALGSYWGAAGEQIDTSSGNLSFALPLVKPVSRGNWSAQIFLSYNSQMWRQDSAGTWLMGYDVGYGLGWTVQIASVIPIWANGLIDHYLFVDSTGAEYSLPVKNGSNVWSSLEGIHVWLDTNASPNVLHMPDGSAWVLGSTSAAAEQDAGTMYPTQIEDSNGNYITITYMAGIGAGTANTSARIQYVTDSRTASYIFQYNTDPIPHLLTITNWVSTSESYSFNYSAGQSLIPPFGGTQTTTTLLHSVTVTGLNVANTFVYDGSGQMTSFTTPLGGQLTWGYRTFKYSGNVSVEEVQSRTMTAVAGSSNSWSFGHPSSEDITPPTVHAWVRIFDNGPQTAKYYYGSVVSGNLVVPTTYKECNSDTTLECNGGSAINLQKDYSWTTDSAGNAYMGSALTTLDPNKSYSVQSKSTQTMDSYGNVTQSQLYDYGNLSIPASTYSYSYLYSQNSTYLTKYIFNRVVSASVTKAGVVVPLYSATYDQDWPQDNGLFLYQHDSAFNTNYRYRGNAYSTSNMGAGMSNILHTIGGVPYQAVDGAGRLINMTPSSGTNYSLPSVLTPNNNSNLSTSLSYATSFAVTGVTGANGATSSMTYSYGRPSSSTSSDGAVTDYTYTYQPNTQTATITTGSSTQWKKTTLDGFGRAISVQTGHDSTTVSEVDTQYAPCACSPLGKLWRTSVPFAAGGSPSGWTTYTYDGSGRTLTVTKPDGVSVTTYLYQGNTTKITDPASKWKSFTNDASGNLISVTEPDPNNLPNGTLVTTYTYNGANQLTDVSMPRNTTNGVYTQARHFTWSGSDLASATNPENGTVSYQYDGTHRVTQRTDAMGQKTTYTYDPYGRLTLVQHYAADGTAFPRQDVTYTYDYPQFSGAQNTWGHLAGVTFNGGLGVNPMAYLYSYNQAGRVTTQQFVLPFPYTLQASYTWDNQGRMASLTYPEHGPTTQSYQYNAMGNLSGITQSNCARYNDDGSCDALQNPTVATATYNFAGQVTNLTYYTDMYSSYTEARGYDNQLRLTSINSGGYHMALLNMQYTYPGSGDNGRISQTVDAISGETVNYTYDALNRLATAGSGSWSQHYVYDGFGNLTGTNGSAVWPADPATNRQGASNGNGNSLANSNVWDLENRLVSTVNPNGQTMTFQYDPWGRRISQTVSTDPPASRPSISTVSRVRS